MKDPRAATAAHEVRSRPHIGLVFNDPLRVRGFVKLFHDIADISTVRAAETVRRTDLTMVVLDADEQLFPLLAAFRRARAGLQVLVLGQSVDPAYISRVVGAGAKGYLSHSCSAAEMQMAIGVVADGSIWAPRKVLSRLIDTLAPGEPSRSGLQFTPREREMLRLLILGLPDRVIANELALGLRTVQAMVRNVMQRVGVTNRVALTVYMLEKHSFL